MYSFIKTILFLNVTLVQASGTHNDFKDTVQNTKLNGILRTQIDITITCSYFNQWLHHCHLTTKSYIDLEEK